MADRHDGRPTVYPLGPALPGPADGRTAARPVPLGASPKVRLLERRQGLVKKKKIFLTKLAQLFGQILPYQMASRRYVPEATRASLSLF